MGISNALVNLGMMPIQDIPQLPKSAREVLPVAGLILEHLQEALGSTPVASGRPPHLLFVLHFLLPLGMAVIYILTYIYIYIYKDIGKLVSLHL
jgi:hypothetical protein